MLLLTRATWLQYFILWTSFKAFVDADIWQIKSRNHEALKPFCPILHNIVYNVKVFEKVVHSFSGW